MHSNIFCSYTKIELEKFWNNFSLVQKCTNLFEFIIPTCQEIGIFSGQCVSGQNFEPIVQKSNPSLVVEDSIVAGFISRTIKGADAEVGFALTTRWSGFESGILLGQLPKCLTRRVV